MESSATTTPGQPTQSFTTVTPLTTHFTPPATCSYFVERSNMRGTGILNDQLLSTAAEFDADCWPTGYLAPHVSSQFSWVSYFSPGACPSGFTTATSSFIGKRMFAYCCSSGYSIPATESGIFIEKEPWTDADFTASSGYICMSGARSTNPLTWTYYTRPGTETGLPWTSANVSTVTSGAVIHYPLKVVWRPDDLVEFDEDVRPTLNPDNEREAEALSSLVSAGGLTSTPPVSRTGSGSGPEETGGDTPTDGNGGGGSSNSRTIGIGVGVGVGVLLLLLLAGFLFWRRRKNKKLEERPTAPGIESGNHFGGIEEQWAQPGTGVQFASEKSGQK